jgi:RNA polymerase sigma-70 factor (family 1)
MHPPRNLSIFIAHSPPCMSNQTLYTDTSLLQGLQTGDEHCFTSIYNKYFKELFYSAEAILGEEILAEDCVQDVFLDLWRRREEATIEHLHAYLKKAVRFKAIDIIRTRKTKQQFNQRIAQITTQFFLQQPMLMKELEAIFHETLQSLPKDQQEIFRLIRDQGLTYREVAEMKGISIKTVEKKMSLSLRDLRLKLGDLMILVLMP